ncbi:hypothetical protein BGS_1380 [Beggiatoa sp. SS]|nr:hypothetical protein BGS_1380 [Beggiatoa sp. SS]
MKQIRYILKIDTQGGDLRLLDLRDYPVKVETPDELFSLNE